MSLTPSAAFDELMADLTARAERAGKTEVIFAEVFAYMEQAEQELFDTEGASGGRPWAEDRPATIDTKSRYGGADATLRDSDALVSSLTHSDDENAIREMGPNTLIFGTKLHYAAELARKRHTKGGTSVPARRPIDFSAKDRYAIIRIFSTYIDGSISRIRKGFSLRFIR